MIKVQFLLLVGISSAVFCDLLPTVTKPLVGTHPTTLRTTLELFSQMEPEISPWWFQRIGDEKPIFPSLPSLNIFGTSMATDDCITLEQCISRRLYGGPMFIVTKDLEKLDDLTAYYTEKGLKTIFKDDLYKDLAEYLRTPEPKAAILFNSRKMYNFKIANKPISKIITPPDFKLMDLEILSRIGDKVPILFVTDKDDFDGYRFTLINHVGKFNIFDEKIEPEIK